MEGLGIIGVAGACFVALAIAKAVWLAVDVARGEYAER
jgi:hypothetical protein